MADIAVFYEHPTWFEPLFGALDRRGIETLRIGVEGHTFDTATGAVPAPVVFNRLSMSSVSRHDEHAIFYSRALLAHWEGLGARVVNGGGALDIDASKARQLSLISRLGLATPATRVVHRRADIIKATEGLRFPLMVKANIGGAGGGMARYESAEDLRAWVEDGTTPTGVDGVALVQEYVPARDGRVIRCETLDGRFLYGLGISGGEGAFDLCPADACSAERASSGGSLLTMRAFQPPPEIVTAVEAIARAAHLDVGGVEYLIDDRDGAARFYDINALSNFVANPHDVLGYDPHDVLVDYLQGVIARTSGRIS